MSNPQALLALLEKAKSDETGLPPVHSWKPQHQADIDMRIARDGRWYYQGSEIERQRMVNLFSTILLREEDDFFLITPVEKLRIQVDDAPFVATQVQRLEDADGVKLLFTTNVDSHLLAGAAHPIWVETDPQTGEPAPYIRVRNNLNALIHRTAFYQLVDWSEQRGDTLVVESDGQWFELGKIE